MDYRFFLINERTGERVEIDEPVKFDGFKPKFKRDDKAHGVTWEYAEQQLDFYGRDGRMIKDEYERYGIDARVVFLVECACGGEWEEFYRGMIDYVFYSVTEGVSFFVSVSVAQIYTQMTLNNRATTKVDLDSLTTFDGSAMERYANLGRQLEVPGKKILLRNKAALTEAEAEDISKRSVDTFGSFPIPFGNKEVLSEIDGFTPLSLFVEGDVLAHIAGLPSTPKIFFSTISILTEDC